MCNAHEIHSLLYAEFIELILYAGMVVNKQVSSSPDASLNMLDQVNNRRGKQGREDTVECKSKAGICPNKLVTIHSRRSTDGMRSSSHG